jgi:hypothetical protein
LQVYGRTLASVPSAGIALHRRLLLAGVTHPSQGRVRASARHVSQHQESHMQPRTLVLKYIVLVSVAAVFFVASPSFAQQKGASSSEMQTKEVRVNGLTLHYIERGQGTPVVLVHGTLADVDLRQHRRLCLPHLPACASSVSTR